MSVQSYSNHQVFQWSYFAALSFCEKKNQKLISKHWSYFCTDIKNKMKYSFFKLKSSQVFPLRITACQQLCLFKQKQLRGTLTS